MHSGSSSPWGVIDNASGDGTFITPGTGFLVVYIDNQSIGKNVWFDNLSIGNYQSEIVEEDHYYPFGLTQNISPLASGVKAQPYKLTTKELEKKFDLNLYDFGARGYDMDGSRWYTPDALAEKHYNISPYAYCGNNPTNRIDPTGNTDYTVNKETGAVTQIGEKNDQLDRILKTNKKGEVKYDKKGNVKVAVDGIENGILKGGMNLKDKGNLISVGGKDQPSLNGVDAFSLKFSNYVGKEIRGTYFSKDGTGNVTDVSIGAYKDASTTTAGDNGANIAPILKSRGEMDQFYQYKGVGFFHTHPTVTDVYHNSEDRYGPSDPDKTTRDAELQTTPWMKHYILTEPQNSGDSYPLKVSY